MKIGTLIPCLTLALALTGNCFAQTPFDQVLSQYTANWGDQSGYRNDGLQWDPSANFNVVFELVPAAVRSYAVSSNTQAQFNFFAQNFQRKLRLFAQQSQSQGLTGKPLLDAARIFLDTVYNTSKPQLAALFPGYPDDVYRGLIIQNLVHGIYVYGTSYYYETITGQVPNQVTAPILQNGQLTVSKELQSLLELTTADCGEIAELTRVLGRVWGLDVRYLGIAPDFWSSIAQKRVTAGAHAIDILVYTANNGAKNALLIDSVTNLAIAPGPLAGILPNEMVGDGIIASTSLATNRYMALANSGKFLGFLDYFMHPPVRSGYLKSSAFDASLIKFMYAYYLEAYPNPARSYASYSAWQVNNQSWSTQQPLY